MSRLSLGLLLAALLVAVPALGGSPQDNRVKPADPKPDVKPAEAKPVEVTAVFQDGTTIRRATLQDNLEVTTKYGKLTVPITDIRRIEFGLHVTDEMAKSVQDAVGKLGSDQFAEREKASKDVVALGAAAITALEKAAKGGDKEVTVRAKAALDHLRETLPADRLSLKEDDVIHTRESVITGRISTESLKARTDYFGEMQFKLSHLRSLVSMARSEATVTLEASKFAGDSDKWVDSGFRVDADSGLVITASGKVELQSGQIVAEPDGAQAFAVGPGGPPGMMPPGGGGVNSSIGALIGRIGERGEAFYVGKRFEGKMAQEGKLYLRIAVIQGGAAPSGSYKVSLLSGPDVAVERRAPAMGMPNYAPGGRTIRGVGGRGPGGGGFAPATLTPLPPPAPPTPDSK